MLRDAGWQLSYGPDPFEMAADELGRELLGHAAGEIVDPELDPLLHR